MAKSQGPFVVVFGGESFFLDQAILTARSLKGRAVIQLDGDGLDDSEFVRVCETQGYDEANRVVVLDNAQDLKGDKDLKAFIESKDPADMTTAIVVVYRGEKLPEIWKTASLKGSLKSHPKFKPWEGDKVKRVIQEEAERLGLRITKDAVDALVFFLGVDLHLIAGELRKLFWLVGKGGEVQRQHVASVVAPAMPAEPFEVADAAAEKNAKKAMNLVSVLYKELGEGVCIPITAALLKMVERLIVARQMLDKGDSVEIIASRFEMHRFRAERYLLPMVRKHTVSDLRIKMKNLCKLDAQVKGSASSKRTLVELAVLSIAV